MHKKCFLVLIIAITTSTFFSCKSKKMDKNDETEIVFKEQKVTKEIHSPDKSKLLILTYLEDMNARKDFDYKIIDLKSKKELITGTFTGIKMEWYTNDSIKGYLFQGMIEKENPQDNFKIINIK